jgi:hypothetical protein
MDDTGKQPQQQHISALLRQFLKVAWLLDHFLIGERQFMLIWAALIGFLGALTEAFRRATDILHHLAKRRLGEYFIFRSIAMVARIAVPTVGGLWRVSPSGSTAA